MNAIEIRDYLREHPIKTYSTRQTDFSVDVPEDRLSAKITAAALDLYLELREKTCQNFSVDYVAVRNHVIDRLSKTLSYTVGFARLLGDEQYPREHDIDRILNRVPMVALRHWQRVLLEVADTGEKVH